jgi:predicted ABC-type ATPase
LKGGGYKLHLFFLWIPTAEFAIARIKDRVAEGGHDVPVNDVRRRFYRGIHNFFKYYKSTVESWMLFDNSGSIPYLIAGGSNGHLDIIKDDIYQKIVKIAGVT